MNNCLERLELVAGTFKLFSMISKTVAQIFEEVTLFGGILFLDDKNVPIINVIVFFLILIVFWFVLNWLYAMLLTFQEKHR